MTTSNGNSLLKRCWHRVKKRLLRPARIMYQIMLPSSHTRYHVAWKWYARFARRRAKLPAEPDEQARRFHEQGFVQGEFAIGEVESFVRSLDGAETIGWSAGDFTPGYVLDFSLATIAGEYNACHRHFVLSDRHLTQIQRWLDSISSLVRSCLRSHWRVANLKLRRTIVAAAEVGPNCWHNDQMPADICKILLYLTPPGDDSGTTEILRHDGVTERISGPAGTWCLFRNSVLEHRGVAPRTTERLVLEITLVPALRMETRPVCPGINTQYPKYPWISRPKNESVG